VYHIARSKKFRSSFKQKPFHILVDYVIVLLDPKVSCACVTRSVVRIIDQELLISFHHPLNPICDCTHLVREQEFKSLCVVQVLIAALFKSLCFLI